MCVPMPPSKRFNRFNKLDNSYINSGGNSYINSGGGGDDGDDDNGGGNREGGELRQQSTQRQRKKRRQHARSRCRWMAIPILPRMTARPDVAPAEAEKRGSWADMARCFQQSIRECMKFMKRAVGINTKQNNQENVYIFLGRLDGSRNTKRGFWVCFSEKSKKGEKFLSAGRAGLSCHILEH
jgi:hypothetical protein